MTTTSPLVRASTACTAAVMRCCSAPVKTVLPGSACSPSSRGAAATGAATAAAETAAATEAAAQAAAEAAAVSR